MISFKNWSRISSNRRSGCWRCWENLLTWAQVQRSDCIHAAAHQPSALRRLSRRPFFTRMPHRKNIALDNALSQDVWVDADSQYPGNDSAQSAFQCAQIYAIGRVELRAVCGLRRCQGHGDGHRHPGCPKKTLPTLFFWSANGAGKPEPPGKRDGVRRFSAKDSSKSMAARSALTARYIMARRSGLPCRATTTPERTRASLPHILCSPTTPPRRGRGWGGVGLQKM